MSAPDRIPTPPRPPIEHVLCPWDGTCEQQTRHPPCGTDETTDRPAGHQKNMAIVMILIKGTREAHKATHQRCPREGACRAAPRPILAVNVTDPSSATTLTVLKEVQILTRNEAGHNARPYPETAQQTPVKAMPAGGHIAEAYPGGIASNRLSRPTTQYAVAMMSICTISG